MKDGGKLREWFNVNMKTIKQGKLIQLNIKSVIFLRNNVVS
jgi:hypothetical protein